MLQQIQGYLETSKFKYLIFSLIIFAFSASTASWYYTTKNELFITYSIRVIFQISLAYIIIEVLIKHLLSKEKTILFLFSLAVTLLTFFIICNLIAIYYLEVTFPSTYVNYIKRFEDASFLGRLTNFSEFISKSLYLLYPTFLLLVFKLYAEKQFLLKLNEQKKSAELTALKNQLNPHFLFNTLNNLYALALKKSDDTTKVIQKLSNILDYILYRCNDEYVPLEKEIDLIENYLSLEKIRYAERVKISFSKNINGEEKIAPLLLLTFVENAFKHGVTNEIDQANININITKKNEQLVFEIENSKPDFQEISNNKESIGLKNIRKQLELLYPKAYHLMIENKTNSFSANLKLDIL